MKKITIKGVDFDVKQTIKAMIVFEQATEKAFELKTMTDVYMYYYCLIISNNPDTTLTFQEFLEALDEDPTIAVTIKEAIQETALDAISKKDATDGEKGKKKRKSPTSSRQ